ncbi:AbfB domain-containing protein [Streptosporangium vulgare]
MADGGWSSFRSHNFPTYHLRHQGNVLRIDPIRCLVKRRVTGRTPPSG